MPIPREFSTRQAARLKARLIAYRALASRTATPLSLMALIHEITDSDAAQTWLRQISEQADDPSWLAENTPLRQERADKGAPMTTNVLQKWFAGELVTRGRGAARMRVRHFTTPSPANLMAIYAFLQEKGFITEGDLKEDRWPHAVLAASYRDFLTAHTQNAGADGAPGPLGEFYSATVAGRDIIIRRLSITERGLGAAVAVEERIMVFARSALSPASSATTIDLHRPRAVAMLHGWGYVSGGQVSLFTSGTVESAPKSHEYKALKSEQDERGNVLLELAAMASAPGQTAVLTQEIATNNPSAFVEQTLATLKAQATRVQGPKIKLLRPAQLPETDAETYALLARCFSYSAPYRFDWERFALLASIIPNINARDPLGGETILHLAARTLNRPAIKALIKRHDLDVLVLDHEGYFPSQRALEADSRSAIGHLLLRRELAAAQARGLDYAQEIARLPITPPY
jgi:hypothetical protein